MASMSTISTELQSVGAVNNFLQSMHDSKDMNQRWRLCERLCNTKSISVLQRCLTLNIVNVLGTFLTETINSGTKNKKQKHVLLLSILKCAKHLPVDSNHVKAEFVEPLIHLLSYHNDHIIAAAEGVMLKYSLIAPKVFEDVILKYEKQSVLGRLSKKITLQPRKIHAITTGSVMKEIHVDENAILAQIESDKIQKEDDKIRKADEEKRLKEIQNEKERRIIEKKEREASRLLEAAQRKAAGDFDEVEEEEKERPASPPPEVSKSVDVEENALVDSEEDNVDYSEDSGTPTPSPEPEHYLEVESENEEEDETPQYVEIKTPKEEKPKTVGRITHRPGGVFIDGAERCMPKARTLPEEIRQSWQPISARDRPEPDEVEEEAPPPFIRPAKRPKMQFVKKVPQKFL